MADNNGGFLPSAPEGYPSSFVGRPISRQNSDENSLLAGSFSSLDNTSLGDSSSPPSPQQSHPSSKSFLKLPCLPIPDTSILSNDKIPFRSQRNHKHETWAQTFHSRPELWIQPQSTEEVQKVILLARRSKKRLITIGSGHSPSDLTCSSSWMLNLDNLTGVLKVRKYDTPSEKDQGLSSSFSTISSSESPPKPQRYAGRALVQAGISLGKLNDEMKRHGLTLPNLGSIDVQSLAGAIATATHGSSNNHNILSSNVRGLRIVLPSGEAKWCSAAEDDHPDLFRAALVSLGALGVITEIEVELAASCNLEWETQLWPLHDALAKWDHGLWDQGEFVRCWWMPYTKRLVVWAGSKTSKACRKPDRGSAYGGWLGYHLYQSMLWIANFFPSLTPRVERLIMGMEHGSRIGRSNGGVDEQRTGLLMDCLYSQFVNEWAIPLYKGPEAIRRLEAWLLKTETASGHRIPFSNEHLYAHAPIEVRIGNGTIDESELDQPRAFLDQSISDSPTLYLNATLYRPYGSTPPWKDRYYQGFEWLMREMGGRPHWAKNFGEVTRKDFEGMYGDDLGRWLKVREEVDSEGMFVGAWMRKNLLGGAGRLEFEECSLGERERWMGGIDWAGERAIKE